MEEFQSSSDWSDWSADELVRELLDDESPLFLVPRMGMQSSSEFDSRPTIEDSGSTLSMTMYRNQLNDVSHGRFVNMFLLPY